MTDDGIIEHLPSKELVDGLLRCFLIFSLGRLECVTCCDLGLRREYKMAFSMWEQPKPKEVEKIGMRLEALSKYTTWYLWKSYKNLIRFRKKWRKDLLIFLISTVFLFASRLHLVLQLHCVGHAAVSRLLVVCAIISCLYFVWTPPVGQLLLV